MNRKTLFPIALILMTAGLSWGVDIRVKVETDRPAYHVGQTVTWSLYAWTTAGGNRGVAMISANLNDSRSETLVSPPKQGLEFADSQYGLDELFMVAGWGVQAPGAPRLRDMTVMQMPQNRLLDIGNNGVPRLLVRGQYVVAQRGGHTLDATLNGANYWPDAASAARAFETRSLTSATFGVFRRGDINFDGRVNSADLALFVDQFGGAPGAPSADIAPVNGDGVVDLADFAVLSGEWLMLD